MAGTLAQNFASLVARFSFNLRLFPASSAKGVRAAFGTSGIEADPAHYLSGSLFISTAAAMVGFLISFFALAFEPLDALAAFLLGFAASFAIFLLMPRAVASKRTEQSESELPFLLREAAIYLDIGLPFEKCLSKIASGRYSLSPDFMRAHNEVKSGATVQSALSGLSARSSSMAIKRCMLLLSSVYETGSGTESLKRTAEELSAAQISNMRTQGGRLSLLAIVFVAASALLPSFFAVFAAVSPLFSSSQLSGLQVWFAFLVAFPSLNLIALAAIFYSLPPTQRQPQGSQELLGEFLKKQGFQHGARAFALILSAASLALAALSFLSGNLPLAALSLCIAPSIYAAASYMAGREVEKAESCLPDALYSAASVHRLLSAEKMLSLLAKGGFGRLSESFEIALRRQKAGESFASSMDAAASHCPSPLVERALGLLTVAYETGAAMHTALRESAEDVVSFFTLVRERAALLAIQRYTVLAASALLVPMIVGTVISIVPSLAGSSQLSGVQPSSQPAIPDLASACQVYLVINSLLSSILLAFSETSPKKAAIYFPIIASLSQVAFLFASSGGLSLLAA